LLRNDHFSGAVYPLFNSDPLNMKNIAVVFLLFTFVIITLGACKTSKKTTAQEQYKKPEWTGEEILFVTMKITGDEANIPTGAKIIETTIASGRVKDDSADQHFPGNGVLTMQLLDYNKVILKEIKQENPLVRRLEYTDDEGTLKSRELRTTEADAFFRLQLTPEAYFVKVLVNSTDKEKPLKELVLEEIKK